jgi:ribosome biogenesis protein SSF1/2
MRHYIITIRATGVSRRTRRVLDASTASANGRKLDLTNDQDISDYLLGLRSNGYDTASESEGDSEAEGSDTGPGQSSRKIELPADYGRSKKGETKAVRLVEIGPRIEMKLGKVVEGVVGGARGEGETVWHERSASSLTSHCLSCWRSDWPSPHAILAVFKSASEKTKLKSTHATKAAEKAARRAEQEANVARKKDEAAAKEALRTSKRGKRPDAAAATGDDADVEPESDGDEVVHDYSGEDEFEFEDRVAAVKKGKQPSAPAASDDDEDDDEDEDGMDDWDGDEEAGEVSSEEEEEDHAADGPDLDGGESSDDEGAPAAPRPARPRPTKKVRK